MEKWRSKGKSLSKEETVLPPTKRKSGQNCLPVDKKKDKKWSFGGILRRISSGQQNESSSNEEDITYIPGHMLTRKKTKKSSKMKSKLKKHPRGIIPVEENSALRGKNYQPVDKENVQSFMNSGSNVNQSQDSLYAMYDSVNSPSSEGSLDTMGKSRKMSRMKARAEAKRDRMCGNSSSEDDSHRSNQSLVTFRSEENVLGVRRTDSCSRRTRGARTERYIKRISRDDWTSSSDSKPRKSTNSPSIIDYYSNQGNPNVYRLESRDPSRVSSPGESSSQVSRGFVENGRCFPVPSERNYDSRFSDRLSYNSSEIDPNKYEKYTWPKTSPRRSNFGDIYGSIKPRNIFSEDENQRILPPEPPPRSSKSRIISNVCHPAFLIEDSSVQQSQGYRQSGKAKIRGCNSDNEIFNCSYWSEENIARSPLGYRRKEETSSNPTYGQISPANPHRCREYDERSTNVANGIPSTHNGARTTSSLPKGVDLFSRQKMIRSADDRRVPESSSTPKPTDRPVPKPRMRREKSPERKTLDENEAERRRSSKNLQEALFELEAIYNSLRLSDPDLLDRAEQRTMDEYRDNAARNAAENSFKCYSETASENREPLTSQGDDSRKSDDMAYRRMHPKERPSSANGQASLSNISYLATSPNLSIRDGDFYQEKNRPRSRRSSPDLTRDDLLFRSMSHAINTLKVIEPQPPFGIPLGPVSGATESDYLHVKPSKYGQTRSLYIPKAEPDVVSDDLAFRNLRKDKDNVSCNKNTNVYSQVDSLIEPVLNYDTSNLRKKRDVRSNSADLTNRDDDWYNDYVKTTQKLCFAPDNEETCNDDFTTNTSLVQTGNDFIRRSDLDINGNRPKCALQRKVHVYVPRDTSPYDNEKYFDNGLKFSRNSRDSQKLQITESEDSSQGYSDSRNSSTSDVQRDVQKNIEQFTEKEISEYKRLCQDLEKLIKQTDQREKIKQEIEGGREDGSSPYSEFHHWERIFDEDYDVPASLLNFNDSLEVPSTTEKEDDRSSSRSVGLSSECLAGSSKKILDRSGDEELLSSASEFGICSNNGSLPDTIYDKFNQLLRDINDVPPIEYPNKIAKYPTEENKEPLERSSSLENVKEAKSEAESLETFDNSSHVLEYPSSPSKHPEDGTSRNLDNLKSLTRRMRKEGEKNEARTKDESKMSEGEIDEVGYDNLLTSSTGLANCSDHGGSTDSVYDKFEQLLREVNDVPVVECKNKIGKYPTDELVNITKNLLEFGSETPRNERDEKEEDSSKKETRENPDEVSNFRDETGLESGKHSKESSSEIPKDSESLVTRRSRAGERQGRDDGLTSREGEKSIEDVTACNDDAYAFKETSVHQIKNRGHVTNSVTVCNIVLCSFLLTLLITIIFAQ